MESIITSLTHMEMKGDLFAEEERAKAVFSKYYDYLPYKCHRRESVLNVLCSRETGTSSAYCYKPSKAKWASSTRKNQCFYMRSLCAAKFGSSVQPLSYPVTNLSGKEGERMIRPRQFEYHPYDSSLMAVETLDGEVVVLNHETGKALSCIFPSISMNSILGLCWLKQQPSKLSLLLVAIYDICSGQQLQLFTDMHREPINVAKFSNHSPYLFVTSSFDRDVKMWDSRQNPSKPCYASRSSGGNVLLCLLCIYIYIHPFKLCLLVHIHSDCVWFCWCRLSCFHRATPNKKTIKEALSISHGKGG